MWIDRVSTPMAGNPHCHFHQRIKYFNKSKKNHFCAIRDIRISLFVILCSDSRWKVILIPPYLLGDRYYRHLVSSCWPVAILGPLHAMSLRHGKSSMMSMTQPISKFEKQWILFSKASWWSCRQVRGNFGPLSIWFRIMLWFRVLIFGPMARPHPSSYTLPVKGDRANKFILDPIS